MKKQIFLVLCLFIFVVSNIFAANEKVEIIADNAKWFNSPAISQKDLKGKIVFVEVFKTWIVSTDNTASYLNLINDTFKSDNFIVMGVSSEQPTEVKKYIDQHKITYPVACGKSSLYDLNVDIPAMFLIVDGEVHSYDPTKKYKFNYLWSNIDNREKTFASNVETWNTERREKYFEFFKQVYRLSVDVRETKTIKDLPLDLDVKYFEKSLLGYKELTPEEQTTLANGFVKQKEFDKYLLKENLSDSEKEQILKVLIKCKYRPIKINETFFKMLQDGIDRIVDSKFGTPLGAPELKLKKFKNMIKKAQSNIYEVININIDELK